MFKVSFLSLRRGQKLGNARHVTIHDQIAVIGREASDLILEDKLVSRQHLALVIQNGEILVRDLKSRNGIFINGHRVLEHFLKIGDKVGIGGHELTVTHLVTETPGEVLPQADGERTIVPAVATYPSAVEAVYELKESTHSPVPELKQAVKQAWPVDSEGLSKEKRR